MVMPIRAILPNCSWPLINEQIQRSGSLLTYVASWKVDAFFFISHMDMLVTQQMLTDIQ